MRVNSISFSNRFKNNLHKTAQKSKQTTSNPKYKPQYSANFTGLFGPTEKELQDEAKMTNLVRKIKIKSATQRISTALNISEQEAQEYYDSSKINTSELFPISRDKVDFSSVNKKLKYDLQNKVILPIYFALEVPKLAEKKEDLIPDGVLLYGEGGFGKEYIIDELCKQCSTFGVKTIELDFDGENHNENSKKIKRAFREAEQNFKETGNYTFIKLKNPIDQKFTPAEIDTTYYHELATFTECINNCAKKGVIWIATSEDLNRTHDKLKQNKIVKTAFKDFNGEVEEMIKYCLKKYKEEESIESFDFDNVAKFITAYNLEFNPAEYDYFTKAAISKLHKYELVKAQDVIKIMIEYANYRFQANIDPENHY